MTIVQSVPAPGAGARGRRRLHRYVRQWALSFPIPLRNLFAVHPELLAPVLQIIHRAIATFRINQTGIKRDQAATDAATLIQRFGSAANLNSHLHALVLDGAYRNGNESRAGTPGAPSERPPAVVAALPIFHPGGAPTRGALEALLGKITTRIPRRLTRSGHLVEADGQTTLAGGVTDPDDMMTPLQAAAAHYRIAQGTVRHHPRFQHKRYRCDCHRKLQPCCH